MGKDANEEKERKPSRRPRRTSSHVADYAQANPTKLLSAIAAAARVGGALRFGYSRDGGAFAIGVYGDGEPYTDFVAGTEEIDETLEYYVELFQDMAITHQEPPASRKKAM
jgi:hypothetical protein